MTPEPHKQEVKKETSIYANQHHSNVYTVNYYFIFSILIKTYPVTLVLYFFYTNQDLPCDFGTLFFLY